MQRGWRCLKDAQIGCLYKYVLYIFCEKKKRETTKITDGDALKELSLISHLRKFGLDFFNFVICNSSQQ